MKKIISLVLCVTLLAGTLAVGIANFPFAVKATADNDDVNTVSAPNVTVPAGYNDARDPYNLMGTTDTKMVSAQNELMFSISTADSSNDFGYRLCDNLKEELLNGTTDKLNLNDNSAYWDSTGGQAITVGGVYFMRSAALDSDGDGARESVVYLGWQKNDDYGQVVAWSFNTRTKQMSSVVKLCDTPRGVYQLYYKDGSWREEATYQSLNFFCLAVGDFNGNGKETAFATVCKKESSTKVTPSLVHLTVSGNSLSAGSPGYTDYMNQKFLSYRINDSGDYEDLLSMRIAAGDINGDGKDDLAVLTYTNNITSSGAYNYDDEPEKDLYTPQLAIGYGSSNGIPGTAKQRVWVDIKADDNHNNIPIAGNVLVDDIDNDSKAEIVVSGYSGQTEKSSSGKWKMLDSSRSANNLIYAVYKDNNSNGLSRKCFTTLTSNGWTKGNSQTGAWLGTLPSDDWCWQPIGLGAAALDGPGTKKYVFINGSVYLYNSNNNTFSEQNTPGYFGNADAGSGGWTISVTFISDVASGVFDGNRKSDEQFFVSVGIKQKDTTSYRYLPAVIGRKDVKDGDTVTRQFYCNDIDDSVYLGGGGNNSGSVAAVDCDNDMFKVKFNNKAYAWTDPDVVAVLQAAPYFGELGDYEGSTSITFSTTYESEYASSITQSLGVGGVLSVDVEVVEAELKAGYEGEWSQTTFNNSSYTTGVTFSAGPEDKVIIQRVPAFYFGYDVWDQATGTWKSDAYHVDVIKDAQYYELSVDEYNTFVDLYNDQMTAKYGNNYSKKLVKISESNASYLIDNEGNPFAYINGAIGTPVSLGHAGGSKSISYSQAYGSGSTTSEANGYSFEFSASGGAVVKVGAYANYSYSSGYEMTQTVVDGTDTEGEVTDINSASIAEETGSPKSIVDQYGFQWSFGEWPLALVNGGEVPVYGYQLTDITTPAPRVTDLSYTVTNGGTNLSFDWSKPDTDKAIAGYFLYKSVDGGAFTKVSDDLITDTEVVIDQTQFDRTKNNVFAVTSAIEKTYPNGTVYYSEGMFSNLCHFNGDLNGKSAYEIALDEGFEGTLEEWLESLKGAHVTSVEKTGTNGLVDTYTVTFSDDSSSFFTVTNGEDGLSAYEIAQSNGYTGTVEQWLTLIGADCAQGHSYVEFNMPASCGRPGYVLNVCSKCGSSELTVSDALEHNYTETVVAPTHTTCGYTRYVCENCGDTYCDNLTAVTDHTYTDRVVEPTCVESGYTEKTCTECGIVIRTDIVPANGHDYTGTVTDPTCSHFGYTTYKCENCDSEYVSDITPTIDHNFSSKVISSTCCTGGYTIKYCADCGFSVIEDEKEAKGHNFEVSNVFAPTCSTTGYSVYTCTDCGINYIDDVTKTIAHTPGEWVCEDPATGRYTQRCEKCYKLLDTKTVAIVSGDGNGGSSSLNPNIDENGVLNIGYQETEKITLKADGIDSSKVVYTSSDPKVATVDEKGNITAVGPGDTIITASIPGTAISTSVPVNVKLTWWQKIHYILNGSPIFRIIFMLFKIPAFDGLPK